MRLACITSLSLYKNSTIQDLVSSKELLFATPNKNKKPKILVTLDTSQNKIVIKGYCRIKHVLRHARNTGYVPK